MKFTLLKELKLNEIPSGSGIVKSGDVYYVVGDDAPYLFILDQDLKLKEKIPLLDGEVFESGRIAKAEKPDFEAMELIDDKELIIFGSGSKSPQRDVFFRILLHETLKIERYDISELYQNLKRLPELKGTELNIEAIAYKQNELFLFNRKKNLVIQFNYKDLLSFIKGESDFPHPQITAFSLPIIKSVEAGFSGATALTNENQIIFTASIENSTNAYDDGEILGSMIGMIDLTNNKPSVNYNYCLIQDLVGNLKIESVSVEKEISSKLTEIVMISDDDKGNSIVISGVLERLL